MPDRSPPPTDVSRGYSRAPSGTLPFRPLGPAATVPNLSFGAAAPSHLFQSSNDLNSAVFGDGRRELQPMWETGSDASSFQSNHLGSTSAASLHQQPAVGDGFDMDEVFGASSSTLLPFGAIAGAGQSLFAGGGAEQASGGTKRAFEDAPEGMGGDDDEMEATDVEDEGNEQPAALAAPGRRLAPRRPMGKTQSMPDHMFKSAF